MCIWPLISSLHIGTTNQKKTSSAFLDDRRRPSNNILLIESFENLIRAMWSVAVWCSSYPPLMIFQAKKWISFESFQACCRHKPYTSSVTRIARLSVCWIRCQLWALYNVLISSSWWNKSWHMLTRWHLSQWTSLKFIAQAVNQKLWLRCANCFTLKYSPQQIFIIYVWWFYNNNFKPTCRQ